MTVTNIWPPRFAAIALASITLSAARAVAAQNGVMEPPSPTLASDDSTMPYPRLTLDEVVARALAVSPTIAAGTGGVRTARSSERMAFGAYLPTVTATSAALRTDATGAVGSTSNQTVGLSAMVDIFTGGRRGAGVALARADRRAAGSTLVSARYAVTLSAQQGFYEVIRASDLVRVARAALAQAEQLLHYTRDRSRAGTVTRSDLLRAQLQVTTMQEHLLAAADTLLSASYALGWLAGVDGPVRVRTEDTSEAIRPLALDDSSIVRLAIDASPSVGVADAVAAANEAALRVARTQYLPTISASAGYDWAVNSMVLAVGARPGWAVAVGMSYPLFNGFQREDAVTRAAVAAAVARVTVGDARRSARASAAQLLGALRTTTTAMALGTEAIRSAREDLRVQTARYRAGISTMLDVLTSESALVQAEYGLARVRHRYHTTRAALEALIGRSL